MHMFSDINRNIYSNPFYLINISYLIKWNSVLPIAQLPIAYWLLPVVLRFLQFVVFASCLFPDSCLYSCNGPIHRVMGFLRPWPRAWGQGFAAEGPRAGWGWGPEPRPWESKEFIPCQIWQALCHVRFHANHYLRAFEHIPFRVMCAPSMWSPYIKSYKKHTKKLPIRDFPSRVDKSRIDCDRVFRNLFVCCSLFFRMFFVGFPRR